MKANEIKINDELVHTPGGTSANMIRRVASLISGVVTFYDGGCYSLNEIETSGKWAKLEKIRGSRSRVESGDTVHFRDSREIAKHCDGSFAYFEGGKKIPKDSIHYDEDENQFWFLTGDDVRAGDIVIHGATRHKVLSINVLHRKVIFEGGSWTDSENIQVCSTDRTFFVCPLDTVTKEEPIRAGQSIIFKGFAFEVRSVKDGTITFTKGGTFPLNKIKTSPTGAYYIDPEAKFWDMEIPNSPYICVAAKDEDTLNHKIAFVASRGFKLWGPTLVKGDHYAQALRK
jgi:hypothetical protein